MFMSNKLQKHQRPLTLAEGMGNCRHHLIISGRRD